MDSYPLSLPSSIDLNAFKAYFNQNLCEKTNIKTEPKKLSIIILDSLVEKWHDNPILNEIPLKINRIYLLDHIDVNLPLKILSANIKMDVFWKRCYLSRWKNSYPEEIDEICKNSASNNWIKFFMEKYLSETIENLVPCNYDQENIQRILDICAPHCFSLEIDHLQPSMGERTDHIPFDFILTNLPELRKFRISYACKTIATEYYTGCSNPSTNDFINLCKGLQKCYELIEFELHSTKLSEPKTLKLLSRSLDGGCSNLEKLSLSNCRFGDSGLKEFLNCLTNDSFLNLKKLDLSNNYLSQQGILHLYNAIRYRHRPLEYLSLKLNPIGTEGAAVLLTAITELPLIVLDLSVCSISEEIDKILLKFLIEHKTLREFDLSNNLLGGELGQSISKVIGFNKTLRKLDIRNCNIPTIYRNEIQEIVFANREKFQNKL